MEPDYRHNAAAPVNVDWRLAAVALAAEVERVTALLRAVRNPTATAMGRWSLSEVAMHLSQAWIIVPGMARDDLSAVYELVPDQRERAGVSLIGDMWELGELTMSAVDSDSERDPTVMAGRIDERAGEFLGRLTEQSARTRHPWMVEGTTVTTTTLICHLLNETIVHGYDIALADGRPWPIPRPHAAMVIDGFLIPVVSALAPRVMVDQQAARGLRATYQIHIRGGDSHLFSFDDGALAVERPGARRVDCHVSVDPTAMLLVAWGRRSHWPAIARGQMMAWGRKPWLGPRFPALMRTP